MGSEQKIRIQDIKRKEIAMTYTKPDINVLGNAASVIQNGTKVLPGTFDAVDGMWDLQPAYDLDE